MRFNIGDKVTCTGTCLGTGKGTVLCTMNDEVLVKFQGYINPATGSSNAWMQKNEIKKVYKEGEQIEI